VIPQHDQAVVSGQHEFKEFCSWAFGNVLDNTLRGVIAEFLVHKAVNGTGKTRTNWDACDVVTPDGLRIEVKASGHVQEWKQKGPGSISFDISRKNPWLASENRYLGKVCRFADVWVFAVHMEKERTKADPFDASQWQFRVASGSWLDAVFGDQKRVSLNVLAKKGLSPVDYGQLEAKIRAIGAEKMPASE